MDIIVQSATEFSAHKFIHFPSLRARILWDSGVSLAYAVQAFQQEKMRARQESTEDWVGDELWDLFSNVRQAINQSATGPKDAIRAIRRRFSDSVHSNDTVAFQSLLLLENCSLKCGYRFLVALATRDNLRDFAKCLRLDTASISERVRQKLLSLFQMWALKYGNEIDFREFSVIYDELKAEGLRFPDACSLPEESTRTSLLQQSASSQPVTEAQGTPTTHRTSAAIGDATLPTEATSLEKSKWNTDLAQVRVNICVLSDLVSEAESSSPDHETKLLMAQIAESLKQMSDRLAQAVSVWEAYQENLPHRGSDDVVLLDMLNVSDELHTVLMRYGRLMHHPTTRTDPAEAAPVPKREPQAVPEHDSFIGEQPAIPTCSNSNTAVLGDNATVNLESPSEQSKTTEKDDESLIDF